jgi:succinate dehydrogenase/fumarate reductase flavoprotein subunit
MWRNVGIERDGGKLGDALEMIDFWGRYCLDKTFDDPDGWRIQGMLAAARLIVRGAMVRTESRGTHRRSDHPGRNRGFEVRFAWRRGRVEPEVLPVARLASDEANATTVGDGAVER